MTLTDAEVRAIDAAAASLRIIYEEMDSEEAMLRVQLSSGGLLELSLINDDDGIRFKIALATNVPLLDSPGEALRRLVGR